MSTAVVRPAGTVRDELREDLLGEDDTKPCDGCGAVARVDRWLVEVTVDDGWVGYCGRCPACDDRDPHVIVDPAGRWME